MRLLVMMFAVCVLSTPAVARDLLAFNAPAFLAGPNISRSAFGVTYVYTGRAPHAASELQLTVVAIPDGLDAGTVGLPAHCLGAFMAELQTRDPGLMIGSDTRSTMFAGLHLLERRWLSQRGERMMTGVTACGLHRGYFVSANFADDLQSAVQSFPALRAALEHLDLRF